MTHILRIDEMAVRFKDDIDNIDNIGRQRRERAEKDLIAMEKRRKQRIKEKKKNAVLKIAKRCEEIMRNCEIQDFFDTYEYLENKKDLNIPLKNFFYEGGYYTEEPEKGKVSIVGAYGGFSVLRVSPAHTQSPKEYIDIVFNFGLEEFGEGWEKELTTFWYDDFSTLNTINCPIYRADDTIMKYAEVNDKGNVILKQDYKEVLVDKTIMKALDGIEQQINEFIDYFFKQVEMNVRG